MRRKKMRKGIKALIIIGAIVLVIALFLVIINVIPPKKNV